MDLNSPKLPRWYVPHIAYPAHLGDQDGTYGTYLTKPPRPILVTKTVRTVRTVPSTLVTKMGRVDYVGGPPGDVPFRSRKWAALELKEFKKGVYEKNATKLYE